VGALGEYVFTTFHFFNNHRVHKEKPQSSQRKTTEFTKNFTEFTEIFLRVLSVFSAFSAVKKNSDNSLHWRELADSQNLPRIHTNQANEHEKALRTFPLRLRVSAVEKQRKTTEDTEFFHGVPRDISPRSLRSLRLKNI
jgi:hypothetical protein